MSSLRPRMLAISRTSFLLVVFICYFLGTGFDLGVRAQSLGLPHDCANSSYSWVYNTEGDPPCVLATDLLRPCSQLINGPDLLNSPCICNSVLYSLDSACRWCSNEPDTIQTFSDFADSFSCTSTIEKQYPETIPPNTPIPAWAYLPLTGDQFDIAGAERMMLSPGDDSVDPAGSGGNSAPADGSTGTSTTTGGRSPTSTTTLVTQHIPPTSSSTQHSTSTTSPAPDSGLTSSDTSGTNTSHNHTTTNSHPNTGNASSNSTGTTPSGTSSSSVPTLAGNASTTTPTGSPGKRSSNHLAAIVGGAVGGVCTVAVLIALGLFLVRRRRRRRHDDGDGGGMGRRLSRRRRGLPFAPQLETSAAQQTRYDEKGASTLVFKLYNPDDPSTYPPPLSEIHSDSKLSTYPGGYLEISDAVKV
ncbi:hypothetical protein GY45DRAFT_1058714 [Cubamyces sp. BRFM 1775]|nr:hypothetical protein GY45DRAFT_1058714 [Cubamyces sp. BRFM 1775]